jgi:hypothetical protein
MMYNSECGTWSLTLREEQILRVFENRVLRRIYGQMREEVVGGWRRLHNEELYTLCASSNILMAIKSRWMRWTVHVIRMEEMRNMYQILVGRPRRTWESNIRMHVKKN